MSSPKCWSRQAALLIFFLCCLFIAWNVPYTHDDWDWGLEESWALWRSGAMNSRYAGTFFVLIMTRSPLVKTLVMGSVMFLLPLLSVRLTAPETGRDRLPLVGLAGGVLFAMPLFCWRQVFGWVSAFANFVLGGLFLLLVLLLWQRAFSSRKGSVALLSLALFFCCLVTQLFAENISVMLLVASLVVAGYALVTRRARLPALASLAACALGTWLMFHNALYSDLMSNGQALDGIRQLAFPPDAPLPEIVSTVMTRYFTTYEALPGLFENFPAVSGLLAAGCVWRLSRQGAPKWAVAITGVWMGGYSLFCAWMMHHLILNSQWVHPWPLLRVAAPLLQLGLTALTVVRDRPETRASRLLLLAAAAGMVVPFALIQEGGPRCLFPSALCLLLCGLSLLSDFPWSRPCRLSAALALAAAVGFHVWVYALIGQNEAVRMEQIDLAVRGEISSAVFPTESESHSYFWGRNPGNPDRVQSFRRFYGLPEHVELVFLPYGSARYWPDIPEDMWEQASRF